MTQDARAERRIPVTSPQRQACPRCGGSSLVRGDTGLCERCTAKTPEAQRSWQDWRAECSEREVRRSTPLPDDYCMVCMQPLGPMTQFQHNAYCAAKNHPCECGRRYSTVWELRSHRYKCQGRT